MAWSAEQPSHLALLHYDYAVIIKSECINFSGGEGIDP